MLAILFDLFNTLVPGDGAQRTKVNAAIAATLGVDAAAFDAAFAESAPQRYVGALGDLADTLRSVARRVGADPTDEQVARACALRSAMTRRLVAAVSDRTLSTLDQLRAEGWRLGVVSNTTPGSAAAWRAGVLPRYITAAAFSDEVGVVKPEAGIYLAACRALEVPAEQCVYVGDGADNELDGATNLGMRAVRTTEHTSTHRTWAGPTISTLADLPLFVGAAA